MATTPALGLGICSGAGRKRSTARCAARVASSALALGPSVEARDGGSGACPDSVLAVSGGATAAWLAEGFAAGGAATVSPATGEAACSRPWPGAATKDEVRPSGAESAGRAEALRLAADRAGGSGGAAGSGGCGPSPGSRAAGARAEALPALGSCGSPPAPDTVVRTGTGSAPASASVAGGGGDGGSRAAPFLPLKSRARKPLRNGEPRCRASSGAEPPPPPSPPSLMSAIPWSAAVPKRRELRGGGRAVTRGAKQRGKAWGRTLVRSCDVLGCARDGPRGGLDKPNVWVPMHGAQPRHSAPTHGCEGAAAWVHSRGAPRRAATRRLARGPRRLRLGPARRGPRAGPHVRALPRAHPPWAWRGCGHAGQRLHAGRCSGERGEM
jgi:hypothetical protein